MAAFERSAIRSALLFVGLAALLSAFAAAGGLAARAAPQTRDSDSRDAVSALNKALRSGDPEALEKALTGVVQAGGAKNMKTLLSALQKIPPREEGIYWAVARGAASFVDAEGMTELGSFLLQKKGSGVAKDLFYALQRNYTRHATLALGPLLRDGPEDLKVGAAECLGNILAPEAVELLIAAMKVEEVAKSAELSPVMEAVVRSLARITGQKYGPNSALWDGWWAKNKDEPLRGESSSGSSSSSSRTGTARDFLEGRRQREFEGLEKAPLKSVVVLSALYKKITQRDLNNDHVDRVLDSMRVPHTIVSREDFLDFDLKGVGAIVINCAQFHQFCICPDCKPGGDQNNRLRRCTGCNVHKTFSAELNGAQIEKLVDFVRGGGYLFCEDWVVKEVLEKAFPKYVSAGVKLFVGRNAPDKKDIPAGTKPEPTAELKDGKVEIAPVRGQASHPYLKGLFIPKETRRVRREITLDDDDDGGKKRKKKGGRTVVKIPGVDVDPEDAKLVDIKYEWQIDDESFTLRVGDTKNVVGLLSSSDLEDVGDGDTCVALAFRPGSSLPPGARGKANEPGVVMMVLSHFGKQGSRHDEHSIENLLLNFLIDAHVARESRTPAAKRAKG